MSGVILAQPIATGATGWQFFDWLDTSFTATAGADGVATIECPQLDPEVMWLVDRAVVQTTSSEQTGLRLYDTYVDVRQVRSGSARGNFDEAEYPTGLRVGPQRSLVAQWVGCSAGATVTMALQGRIFRRT